ncbi:MAG: hypothetical protein JWN01_409 [Patescibacteria group bacterium]|nr:hypothetical protein [Patescibacteria group bacterium]
MVDSSSEELGPGASPLSSHDHRCHQRSLHEFLFSEGGLARSCYSGALAALDVALDPVSDQLLEPLAAEVVGLWAHRRRASVLFRFIALLGQDVKKSPGGRFQVMQKGVVCPVGPKTSRIDVTPLMLSIL